MLKNHMVLSVEAFWLFIHSRQCFSNFVYFLNKSIWQVKKSLNHFKIELKGLETLLSTLKTSKRQIISLSNWHAQTNPKSNSRNWTYHPERRTIKKVKIRINLQFTYESFSCIFPQANFIRWKRENEQIYKYMIMYY